MKKAGFHDTGDEYVHNGICRVEPGALVQVVDDIVPNIRKGKVRYKGLKWAAKSSDIIREGEHAKIIGCDILTIIVEKAEPIPDDSGEFSFHSNKQVAK